MDDLFDNESVNSEIDYEKESYGKRAYKRVRKLRRRGERRGIDIPELNYVLTKPERPRIPFFIAGIVLVVMLVAILVGIVFLYNELVKAFAGLEGLWEFFTVLLDPENFKMSLGLSLVPAILIVMVYILVFILFLLPFVVAMYFYKFIRDTFYLAVCSKEEFAKGYAVSNMIMLISVLLVTITSLFVVGVIYVTQSGPRLMLGLVYGGLMLSLGGMLALIIAEKVKSAKWFAGLDEYRRKNFLEHDRGLRSVKRRLGEERRFFSTLGH